MGETGTSVRADASPKRRDGRRPLRVVWSGSHIGRKALPILLYALAKRQNGVNDDVEIVVLGDGPESGRWRTLAGRLGLAGHIRWTGALPRADALAEVASGDVLAFTGVQEGTPHAGLEALSLGLPVGCHDACGMGTAVTADCGVKVPLRDPRTSVDGFRAAIRRLASDALEFGRLSEGALRRAEQLSWDAKVREIANTYDRVIATGGERRLNGSRHARAR
jgi:glycosyltransferase involved in cell wall biosynthesis